MLNVILIINFKIRVITYEDIKERMDLKKQEEKPQTGLISMIRKFVDEIICWNWKKTRDFYRSWLTEDYRVQANNMVKN